MASHTNTSPLITAEELARILGKGPVGIVDCRFSLNDTDLGRSDWEKSRIPGARYAHLDTDLSAPLGNDLQGRHPMPTPEHIASLRKAWGFDHQTLIVCYDDAGGAFASRLWWMLRWIGHEAARVLDGGWVAWKAGDYPVDSLPVSAINTDSPPTDSHQAPTPVSALVADVEDVRRMGARLIDARASERYEGRNEPIDPVAGHIPGASNLPWQGNLDASGSFLSPTELRDRWGAVGGTEEAIVYCGSGVTACHNILSAAVAGLPMPKLFPPSWSGWIADTENPIQSNPV